MANRRRTMALRQPARRLERQGSEGDRGDASQNPARPVSRTRQVHDVRDFMRDQVFHPVGPDPELRLGLRGCRPEDDEGPVEERKRHPVRGRLRIADEDVDRTLDPESDSLRDAVVDRFDRPRGALRPGLERGGEVDPEVRRLDRPPRGGGSLTGSDSGPRQKQRQPECPSGHPVEASRRSRGYRIRAAIRKEKV